MGLVELVMALGFKGLGKGLKKAGTAVKQGVETAAKGTSKAIKAAAKGIKSLLKSGAKLVSRTGSMLIRNGKLVIKGLQKGFANGIKKLSNLIGKLLEKYRFKSFELEREGDFVVLYGIINPRLKLAKWKYKGKQLKLKNADDAAKELSKQELEAVETVSDSVRNVKRSTAGAGKVNEFGEDFAGTLRGEKIQLPGVKTKEIKYVKRNPIEAEALRKAFDSTERKKFLQSLTDNAEKLKKAGLSDSDIARMKDGLNPKGWQVHHKLPLDGGGTNAMDNLVLIKNEPYHKTITNFQNTFAKELNAGDVKKVKWPIPEGSIYPPNN